MSRLADGRVGDLECGNAAQVESAQVLRTIG